MSYFDVKLKHYTEILRLIDGVIASEGNVQEVRGKLTNLIAEIEEIKSQI